MPPAPVYVATCGQGGPVGWGWLDAATLALPAIGAVMLMTTNTAPYPGGVWTSLGSTHVIAPPLTLYIWQRTA